MKLQGQRALVTGASSGIGSEIARQLGAMGAGLVLSARRKDRLDTLAEEIRAAHGVDVEVVVGDLGEPATAGRLFDELEGRGTEIDILVNNAGFGVQAPFLDIAWERTQQQMQLNMISLTELSWRFATAMRERGRGRILNVSSTGAYQPVPGFATYAAGKAYVRNFSEALAYELAGSGVTVCCVCPGGTETEFSDVAGQELPRSVKATLMSAEDCARIALSAMLRGRRNVVAGVMNKVMCWLMRFLPRRTMVWAAAMVMAQTAPKLRQA